MAKKTCFAMPVLALLLVSVVASFVQADPGGKLAPEIRAVLPIYDEDLLVIFGTNLFHEMNPPTVMLAGQNYLSRVTEDGEVLVDINLNLISPGDYLLVLKPDHRVPTKAEFMLTLGTANSSATVPSTYFVDTDFFWIDDAVQRAHIQVACHNGDISAGGLWFASPEERTVFVGGGSGLSGYVAILKNSQEAFGARVIAKCLDFSEPFHSQTTDYVVCDYDPADPGDYNCFAPEH